MDMGIALEAALWAADKGKYQGELKYRFKLRETILLGGTTEERRQNAKLLGQLYDLRSLVAHGRRFPQDDEEKVMLIQHGLDLCCRLIEALAMRGRAPDWDGMAMGWETPTDTPLEI